jgi:glycosyltransferase involved in cell wall biosynthesis
VKALFVDHVDRVLGGAEINLLELLAEAQRHSSWDLACACRESGPLGKRIRALGIRTFDYGFGDSLNTLRFAGKRFPWSGIFKGWIALRRASADLAHIFARHSPDLVISCAIKDHLAVARATRQRFVRSIWWVNDLLTEDFFSTPARAAVRMAASRPQQIVCVSECVAQPFRQWGLAKKTRVIHNGIPLERYRRHPRGALRKQLGLSDSEPLFGVVGRFCEWKGQRLFLEIAEMWAQFGRPGHFVLIGQAFNEDKPYEMNLRHFVAESSLQGRAHFIPFQDDIAAALSDLDALLHTSLKPEPFGRVLIEAMAVGIPVIAANSGGPREIIQDEINGFLAKPNNASHYVEKLAKVKTEALAAEARRTVEQNFTIQRVLREFEALIEPAP